MVQKAIENSPKTRALECNNTLQQSRRPIGKDEVGGSNLPSSSKKFCFREKTELFLYFLADLICGSGCGATLTHTLTHTRKCTERAKEERTELVPSRFMRKIVCRLRLNEVSRQ